MNGRIAMAAVFMALAACGSPQARKQGDIVLWRHETLAYGDTRAVADPRPESHDEIVAQVGCTAVYRSELEADPGAKEPGLDSGALAERLLRGKLVERLAFAEPYRLAVSEEEIDRAIDAVAAQNGLTTPQLHVAIEDDSGIALDSYRRSISRQILEHKLGSQILASEVEPGRRDEAIELVVSGALGRLRVKLEGARIENRAGRCFELPP